MEWVKFDGMHLFLLDYIRPFLAMASLKSSRLWRCSFGLTKRLKTLIGCSYGVHKEGLRVCILKSNIKNSGIKVREGAYLG